jgi:hypothetical protein
MIFENAPPEASPISLWCHFALRGKVDASIWCALMGCRSRSMGLGLGVSGIFWVGTLDALISLRIVCFHFRLAYL